MRNLLCSLAIFLSALPLSAQSAFWLPTPQTDPTEFGSLALDPSESLALPKGQWAAAFNATYFNQWAGTWHTGRVHRDRKLQGQSETEDEIAYLEAAFPHDPIYRVDVEGYRSDLFFARGAGHGLTFSARIPWITIGGPQWDAVAEDFHKVLPASPSYGRDLFARGDTLIFVQGHHGIIERRGELARSGVGDVVLDGSLVLPGFLNAENTLGLAVQLPTGKKDTLQGSGGVDVGLRYFSTWTRPRRSYFAGAGVNHQSHEGTFLGIRRSDSWNVILGVDQPLTRHVSATVRTRIDSSPLQRIVHEDLGRPVVYWRLGMLAKLSDRRWIAFELGDELLPQIGIDADWSAHLTFGTRFGSAQE